MSSLISLLLDDIDFGIGVCDLETLKIVELNKIMAAWVSFSSEKDSLQDYIPKIHFDRLIRSIKKKRIYRFKLSCHEKQREISANFISKIITFENGKEYLLLQGIRDDAEEKIERIIRDYDVLTEKNNKLLQIQKEKAEQANNAKSLFLAAMSHELRTPMNGVLGVTQRLEKTSLSPAQAQLLNTVRSSGIQLLGVINGILDYAKLEDGKIELCCRPYSLKAAIEEVIDICSANIENRKKITVSTEFDRSDYPDVYVDDLRLKQILINLLSNAIKFTHQGHVKVHLEIFDYTDKDCIVEITVSDTGIGIEQEKIPGLFDVFTQSDASTSRTYGGTGLGLSICRQLVALMDGSIEVTSSPNSGSKFKVSISLPIVESSEASTDETESTEQCELQQKFKGKKILAVDDTEINLEIIKMALEDLDVHLVMAKDGKEAINQFRNNNFDIILMDCLMPVMDGFDTTKTIRSMELKGSHVPIIAVTASTSNDIDERCKESGMDDVILKPIMFDSFPNEVGKWLS